MTTTTQTQTVAELVAYQFGGDGSRFEAATGACFEEVLAALGALDPGQSPENLQVQLQKVKDTIERWRTAKAELSGGGRRSTDVEYTITDPTTGKTTTRRLGG